MGNEDGGAAIFFCLRLDSGPQFSTPTSFLRKSSSFLALSFREKKREEVGVGGRAADFLTLVAVPPWTEFCAEKEDLSALRASPSFGGRFFFRRGVARR